MPGAQTRWKSQGNRRLSLKMEEVKKGIPATVYHFPGSLGHPVATQDPTEDLLFFKITNEEGRGNTVIVKVPFDEK